MVFVHAVVVFLCLFFFFFFQTLLSSLVFVACSSSRRGEMSIFTSETAFGGQAQREVENSPISLARYITESEVSGCEGRGPSNGLPKSPEAGSCASPRRSLHLMKWNPVWSSGHLWPHRKRTKKNTSQLTIYFLFSLVSSRQNLFHTHTDVCAPTSVCSS